MKTFPAGFSPADLGIILSYHCQSACAHCLYNCGPHWQDWMDPDDLEKCLQAAARWTHPFQVHFTGGEPFLNFPLLHKGIKIASGKGIPCYVETNAGWCLDESQTWEQFQVLRAAGLGAVQISCSPFHAASIPLERTLRAISAAVEVFGLTRVWVYRSEWIEKIRMFDLSKVVPLERFLEGRADIARQLWDGYGLLGGGRAGARLGHLTQCHPPESFRLDNCRHEILHAAHAHVDLYGNIIPAFCSGINLGGSTVRGAYAPLVNILVESGAYGLFHMACEQYAYRPLKDGYADKCHLCMHVRRHLFAAGKFEELAPAAFYEFG
jgi:hypothetical protein